MKKPSHPFCTTAWIYQEYLIHLSTSGRFGFLPYIKMPMRKMRPVSHKTPHKDNPIMPTLRSTCHSGAAPCKMRANMRIGVKNGINDNTTAIVLSGVLFTANINKKDKMIGMIMIHW